MLKKMNENMEASQNAKYERSLARFDAKYGKIYESISKSSTFKGSLTKNDRYNLGVQIDRYKMYESYVAENSSAASLGQLPKVALDLISASYALTVAPQLASIQPLDDAEGLIYFKKAFTHGYPMTATKGLEALPENRWMNADGSVEGEQAYNGKWKAWHDHRSAPVDSSTSELPSEDITAKNFDATTFNAKTGWDSDPTAYMSERQVAQISDGTVTIPNIIGNVRWNVPMKVRLTNADGSKIVEVAGLCSGPGMLPKFYGEVDVTATASGNDLIVTVDSDEFTSGMMTYDVDFEKAPDVPSIEFALTSQNVSAEIIGLKEMVGTFKSFQFNKRFGRAASDEQLADLSGHMAMAESNKVIKAYKIAADKYAPITWNMDRAIGVSEYEHRQSFKYAVQAASSAIGNRCGRGYANRIICGYVAAQYFDSLQGFVKAPTTYLIGPHVYGTIDGITIIRSNSVVSPNEVICGFVNETSPFEAPVVDATYMPIFVTDTLPVANNPFQSQRAIASWKAITPVVPEFVQRIVLIKGGTAPADQNIFITNTPKA